MNVRFGIDVQLNAAGAIGGLNNLGQRLSNLATPGRTASLALDGVARIGQDAAARIEHGAYQAENAWGKLSQTIGMPLQLGSLFAAVSGINNLRQATIGANASLETAQVRMAGTMRNWNDSSVSAMAKSQEVMKQLREYALLTPFETQPLVEAAAIASQVSRDPAGVMDVTKLGARLAAYKGTNDPTWSTRAIVSAMQGNFTSLNESFGIAANQQMVESLAAQTGYGRTARGRYEALKRLIEMRVGKEGPDDVVHLLARTGMGITSTLKDQFSMPLTDMTTAGYKEGVAGLVRFSEALQKFQDSAGFKRFSEAMSNRFLGTVKIFTAGLDSISRNLERLPALFDQYSASLRPLLTAAGVILGVNVAVLALKGGAGLLLTTLRGVSGVLMPFLGIVLNPLVIAGLVGLTAALWPLVKGLDVGGLTVEKRWHGLVQNIIRTDLRSVFARPLQLIRDFLSELSEGRVDWKKIFAPNTFLGDLAQLSTHIRIAFTQAVVDVFPEAQPALARLNELFAGVKGWLTSLGVDVPKVAMALGGVSLAFRVLGLGSPWLLAAGAAFRGLATGIGLVQIAIANPALAAGVAVLAALLSPLLKDMRVFGRTVGDWMGELHAQVSTFNWQGLFAAPMLWLRGMAERLLSSDFSFTDWLKQAFDPGSILGFLGGLARPIWTGLLGALDQVAPELRGWFTDTFGNVGQVITDALRVVTGVAGPLLDGVLSTLGPTLKAVGAVAIPVITAIWKAFSGFVHWLAEAANSPAGQGFVRFLGGVVGVIAPLMVVGRALMPVLTTGRAIAGVFGSIGTVLSGLGARAGALSIFRTIGAGLAGRFPMLGSIMSVFRALGGVAARIPALLGPVGSTLLGFLTRIPALLGPIGGLLLRIGGFFVGGPIGIAVGIVTALVGLGTLLYNRWKPFHDLADRVGDKVRGGFHTALEAGRGFVGWVTALPGRVAESWEALKLGAGKAGADMGAALHERLNAWAYWFTGLPDRLAKTWDSLKTAASNLGTQIYTGLTEGIQKWLQSIPQVMSGFMDNLPAPIKAALEWVQNQFAPTPAAPAPLPIPQVGLPVTPLPVTVPILPGTTAPVTVPLPPGVIGPPAPVHIDESGGGGLPAPMLPAPQVTVQSNPGTAPLPPITVHAPLTIANAAGMSPQEIQDMHRRHLAELLPEAINAALSGVMFA